MFIIGQAEDERRREEILENEAPKGWPNVVVTSLPKRGDLTKSSELSRLVDIAERLGDSGFKLRSIWGDEMEVRIDRPLPPPDFL